MTSLVTSSLKKQALAIWVAAALLPVHASAQTLEQAVAKALDSYPEIHQAFNRFKVREEQVEQAKSAWYPTVDFDAAIGREWTDSPSTRTDAALYDLDDQVDLTRSEVGITLQQVLFQGFRTVNDIKRTEFEMDAEQWTLFATAEDLALDVAKVYLEFLRAEQIVALAKQNLASHQAIFDSVKEKTESGFGSSADLSQVTGRLARANSNYISAQNNLSDTKVNYLRLIDEMPSNTRLPVPDAVLLPASFTNAITLARDNHPTLKMAENDISAATAQRDMAKANYYPTVTFDLSARWDDNLDGVDGIDYGSTLDVTGDNEEVLAMVRLRYNLYAGGKDKALERESAYGIQESKAILQHAYREVVEGTTLAWNAREFLAQQLGYLRQHVESATDTRDAFQDQFSLGQRTLFDVLDAENELFEARKEYLTAEYDDLIAQYRLLNATGHLLQSLRVEMPSQWQAKNGQQGGQS